MNHYEHILNDSDCDKPILPTWEADAEIRRLHGVIAAQAETIAELQQVLRDIARIK